MSRFTWFFPALLAFTLFPAKASGEVKSYTTRIDIPTYRFSGRETEPPLFRNSSVSGQYPFVPFLRPLESEKTTQEYDAVILENEYLKLTYLPEFGGRFFSLFDKVRKREVFYRNDVIKPAGYNAKNSFPLFGIELTGPWDTHMLTLYGEPFWSHKLLNHADGSVSLVLGNVDPVYRMKVNFAARLYPGVAALQLSVSCYNTRDLRMPQMMWISGALRATDKTRFIYPMTRTVGHTTSEIADWPVHNGIDYSWDRNNRHMLGVFGIDIYDDFQGAYHFDLDYGVFRHADRRIVQGMKLWTFGYSERATNLERAYTDTAGPYIEVQSGRHVWDGHYEWVLPNKTEVWSEWWIPVAGIGGFTTTSRDLALNLDVGGHSMRIGLSATRVISGASIEVTSDSGSLLRAIADLEPGTPFNSTCSVRSDPLTGLTVTVRDVAGAVLLNYVSPDRDPGRTEYTPFTAPLEKTPKTPEQMTVEELVLAAEYRLKELNTPGAMALLEQALSKDAGFSRAHLLLGIHHLGAGHFEQAIGHLREATARDPYLDEAHYYLAIALLELDQAAEAERSFYYLWPGSAYYPNREFHLGRQAFLRGDRKGALGHLEEAVRSNGSYLSALALLALVERQRGNREAALEYLARLEAFDPTSQWAPAERYFLAGDAQDRAELESRLGGQSQEALDLAILYQKLERWEEATHVLRLVEQNNRDAWGTPAEFYYTLAYCTRRSGETSASEAYLAKARSAASNVDRFPYREESHAVFREALERDPHDPVAAYLLGCLQYHRGNSEEALQSWQRGVNANPESFSLRRVLGLGYAEQGYPLARSLEHLEKAVELNPLHLRTMNDLTKLYARSGRFEEQTELLKRALARSPDSDDLAESLLAAYVVTGRFEEAEEVIASHPFQPQHRSYGLRDKYRFLCYAQGARAFNAGDFDEALERFQAALEPPVSLGVDDFQFESTPRVHYYIGRTLERLGRESDAQAAYRQSVSGLESLSSDWDSLNLETFYMALALERLGRHSDSRQLLERLEGFAQGQYHSTRIDRQAASRYLVALIRLQDGDFTNSRRLMDEALELQPDLIPLRLELRGEVLDPLPEP